MVGISDLPEIAVQHILRRARGRCIAGTSRYARVCRRWRDAEEEAEPLQLFMHLDHLSKADLARASNWLCKHGQTVDVLVVQEHLDYKNHSFTVSAWFVSVAPALRNLRRLEVAGIDTLVGLAPVLQQLPYLQHLEATVHLSYHPQDGCAAAGIGSQVPPGTFGKFTTAGTPLGRLERLKRPWERQERPWDEVPDMQHLCPQLTSLHLMLQTRGRGLRIDPRVSRLVTPQLQQLKLINGPSWGCTRPTDLPILCTSSLVHLSALQQLTLELAQRLGAL
jgi:hypothetical protein